MLKTDIHDHYFYKIHISELKRLAESTDFEIVKEIIQIRINRNSPYLFGIGKIQEIKQFIIEQNIETVIIYNTINSKQKLNLQKELYTNREIEILDKYDLILQIFEKNSSDKISKIQIRLAQLRKDFPFYKLQAHIKYKRESPARVYGPGEFAYHSKIKNYDKQLADLKSEIDSLKSKKLIEIQKRREILNGGKIVCIAGHYNAGKTTLFNLLTGAQKLVSDQPFTTLSSKYQRINNKSNIMLVDTIGFVVDLDPRLIESFELNFLDMRNADIIAYLVALDDEIDILAYKLEYGLKLLKDIGISSERIIIIFNKTDLISKEDLETIIQDLEPIIFKHLYFCLSAKSKDNINELLSYFENS